MHRMCICNTLFQTLLDFIFASFMIRNVMTGAIRVQHGDFRLDWGKSLAEQKICFITQTSSEATCRTQQFFLSSPNGDRAQEPETGRPPEETLDRRQLDSEKETITPVIYGP